MLVAAENGRLTMTIYPRGVVFVLVAVLIFFLVDRFNIDWRIGLLAVSLDALATLLPFFAYRGDARASR
jgi:hypothetical protein